MTRYRYNASVKVGGKVQMKNIKFLLVIYGLIALMVLGAYAYTHTDAASAQKSDAECTGQETVGRCADKCPEGSYSIGIGKNGEAICKLEPTGCPYGDSIPLGEECNRQAQAAGNDPSVPDVENNMIDYPESSIIGK